VVKPLERLGERERRIVEERRTRGYARGPLTRFPGELEVVLRALLARLLPGVPAQIDLAAFVDAYTGEQLGRGDREAGLPPEPELFDGGLRALAAAGFVDLPEEQQRDLITRMRRGDADDELAVPAKAFVDRLLDKALTGYLAHPDTWERIGFNGPAYPEGYAWIGPAEVVARHDRKPGWDRL
jgi:hypothetical protein